MIDIRISVPRDSGCPANLMPVLESSMINERNIHPVLGSWCVDIASERLYAYLDKAMSGDLLIYFYDGDFDDCGCSIMSEEEENEVIRFWDKQGWLDP